MQSSSRQVEAYVLHTRSFTDSKIIVSVFAGEIGRVSAVFRSSKRQTKPSPFTRYHISLSGAGSLKTLRAIEPIQIHSLSQAYGRPLFCGIYLNELIIRALPEEQVCDSLLELYGETIDKIGVASHPSVHEVLLRRFEFKILQEMGLGLNFDSFIDENKITENDSWYQFVCGEGFQKLQNKCESNNCYSGAQLHAIAVEDWNHDSLSAAKKLSRIALKPLLGERPIKARELFT